MAKHLPKSVTFGHNKWKQNINKVKIRNMENSVSLKLLKLKFNQETCFTSRVINKNIFNLEFSHSG